MKAVAVHLPDVRIQHLNRRDGGGIHAGAEVIVPADSIEHNNEPHDKGGVHPRPEAETEYISPQNHMGAWIHLPLYLRHQLPLLLTLEKHSIMGAKLEARKRFVKARAKINTTYLQQRAANEPSTLYSAATSSALPPPCTSTVTPARSPPKIEDRRTVNRGFCPSARSPRNPSHRL
ncbi:hypothetical protein MA16_Dca021939 [Dendrobium catenatum]|uniref:Uncharacterized protein n=1 Tax=Dendrobium catenatum TaxID=906689 RepID=A0A2I0VG14_9ASPA|nr:hypothetical protein MA16_Dca021939 [Dendrobium catenatum]